MSSLIGGSASSGVLVGGKATTRPKAKAKGKAKLGQKRTHLQGPGAEPTAVVGAAARSGAAKVDPQSLVDEGDKWLVDFKDLADLDAVSVEAAANLGGRLQAKSRSLGNRPGNQQNKNTKSRGRSTASWLC